MSFRIWTILYVFAVVAASLALFGVVGPYVAAFVLGFWAVVYWPSKQASPIRRLLGLLLAIFVLLLLIALLLPAISRATETARQVQCRSQLRNLALAMRGYLDVQGTFPPAYVADANGKPILGWRVTILPYLDEQAIYDRFDLAKPWDDPTNRQWSSASVDVYHCPSAMSYGPTTDYFAVVGPHTAWPEGRGRPLGEITDDPATTIMLVEAHGRQVNWAEPRDLTFDEAVQLLTRSPERGRGHQVDNGFFYKPSSGWNVAFADGRVQFIRMPLDRELAEALLTVDGGEQIDTAAWERLGEPQLDYAKCYVFAVFVVLAVLPAAWLWRGGTAVASIAEEREGAGDA